MDVRYYLMYRASQNGSLGTWGNYVKFDVRIGVLGCVGLYCYITLLAVSIIQKPGSFMNL